MTIRTSAGKIAGRLCTLLAAVALTVLAAGCSFTDDEYTIEYSASNLSYYDGDSYLERYVLHENRGTYERYIAGTYQGKTVPGIWYGTLFETGTYETAANDTVSRKITFHPKKRYDFDTGYLKNLGILNQEPFYGILTEEKLAITWTVVKTYNSFDVTLEYSRN